MAPAEHSPPACRAHLEVDGCLLVVHLPVVAGRALLGTALPGCGAGGIVHHVIAASICSRQTEREAGMEQEALGSHTGRVAGKVAAVH